MRFAIGLVMGLFCTNLSAQDIDTNYITPYKTGLIVSLQNAFQDMRIGFDAKENAVSDINYEPNNVSKSGVRFAYNGVGLGLMFKSSNYGKDPTVYGKTDQFSLHLDVTARKWAMNIGAVNVQGFYLEPLTYNGPQPLVAPRPIIRKDLQLNQIGISYTRVFNNDRFSYKMLINQSEMQRKSAGSFLLKGNFYIISTSSDTSFIPRELVIAYAEVNDFNEAVFSNIILQPGYAHTFVIGKRLSFNLRALLGFGAQGRTFVDREGKAKRDVGISSKLDFGVMLNYFGQRFFTGVGLVAESLGSEIGNVRYSTSMVQGELFVGYRFPQVKLFQKKSFLYKIGPVKKWIDGEI